MQNFPSRMEINNAQNKRKNEPPVEETKNNNEMQITLKQKNAQKPACSTFAILFQINFTKLFVDDPEAIALFRTNQQSYFDYYPKYTLKQYYQAQHILPLWRQSYQLSKPVLQKCENIESISQLHLLLDFVPTLTHLCFASQFNESIKILNAPWQCSITHVRFGFGVESINSSFNRSVDELPSTLTHLCLSDHFNLPIDQLPPKLTHLIFGYKFNCLVNHLPSTLTDLTFGADFNQPISRFPACLINLTFGFAFNQPIENLPGSLTRLTFGFSFNQSINHFPSSLTGLTFGHCFNQSVNNLPRNLIYLAFGYYFNQPVDHLSASRLTHLKFHPLFNQSILDLPSCLSHLTIGAQFNQPAIRKHLASIKTWCFIHSPSKLKHMVKDKVRGRARSPLNMATKQASNL